MEKSKKITAKEKKRLVLLAVKKCHEIGKEFIRSWKPINNKWETINCCLYLRLSTDDQVISENESLSQQIHILLQEVTAQSYQDHINYKITKIYIDAGISGQKDYLPQFDLMERSIVKRLYGAAFFRAISRLARNADRFGRFFNASIKAKCLIKIKNFPINPNDPASVLFLKMMALIAEYEAKLIEQRCKDNVYSAMVNNKKFNSTHKVLGLDQLIVNGEEKVGLYTPNQEELKIVEWIMRTFVKLESYRLTLEVCEKKGIKNKSGKEFKQGSLKTLLTNLKYIGQWEVNIENKGEDQNKLMYSDRYQRVDLPHGPVINQKLWDDVQRIVEKLKNSRAKVSKVKRVYPLSGILKYIDGTPFSGSCNKGRNDHFFYYQNIKNRIRLPVDEVEAEARKIVGQIVRQTPELQKAIEDRTKKLTSSFDLLKGQFLNVEVEIEKKIEQREVLDRRLDFLLDGEGLEEAKRFKESYVKKLGEIDKDISELESAKAELEDHRREFENDQLDIKKLVNRIENVQKIMQEHDPAALKAAYRAVFESIVVSDLDKSGKRGFVFNVWSDSTRPPSVGVQEEKFGFGKEMGWMMGLEPTTTRITIWRSTN